MNRQQYEHLRKDRPDLELRPWAELYNLKIEVRKWKRRELVAHLTALALTQSEPDPLTFDVPF